MNNTEQVIDLNIDEFIWVVFIFLSILNICGDELEKKCIISDDNNKKELAKKIFTITVFISLLIYIYFANRNYKNIKKAKLNNGDTKLLELRFLGSILVVVGVILLLYFQINSSSANNPSII